MMHFVKPRPSTSQKQKVVENQLGLAQKRPDIRHFKQEKVLTRKKFPIRGGQGAPLLMKTR